MTIGAELTLLSFNTLTINEVELKGRSPSNLESELV